jgi:hypothetical protein
MYDTDSKSYDEIADGWGDTVQIAQEGDRVSVYTVVGAGGSNPLHAEVCLTVEQAKQIRRDLKDAIKRAKGA